MKLTFDYEDGTVINTTPDKLQVINNQTNDGIALHFGNISLLSWKGATLSPVPKPDEKSAKA